MAPFTTLATANAMATLSPITPLQSQLGQQIFTNTSVKFANVMEYYTPNQTPFVSGPASLVLFINVLQFGYMVKIGQFKPRTPEYNALLKNLRARVPLRLSERDIVDPGNLDAELSMSDVAKLAQNLRLFYTKTYFAFDDHLKLSSSKAEELKEKTTRWSYRYAVIEAYSFDVLC